MYKKTSKLIAGVMALAMAAVPTISAAPAEQSRTVMVIGESTFEKKSLPWHISSALPAKQSFELEDGTFHISIRYPEGADREKWDLQFRHRNLNFRAGHEYKVSFKAKSKREGFELCSQICDVRNDQNYFVLDGMTNDMHMGPDMGGQWPASAVKLTTEWQTYEGVFKPTEDIESAEWSFYYAKGIMYQGNAREGDEIWFDDMVIECLTCEESGDSMCGWHSTGDFGYVIPRSDVRLNQAGYYPDSKKVATYVTADDREAMDFRVLDEKGKEVLKGRTVPVGPDPEAGGGFFHKLDYSEVKKPGRYTIAVDDEKNVFTNPYSGEVYKRYISHEFTVGDSIYGNIFRDAMNFFYLQRSDTDLDAEKIIAASSEENKAKLAHKAYHANDEGYLRENWYSSNTSNKIIDVSGGWYTDDNCGKNIIAGANTVWLLQNMYELSEKNGNESLSIALDEARYELEFMLDMVVDPEKDSVWGENYADMIYHGVRYFNTYDPVNHTLDMKHDFLVRLVNPPTYAATFDFIACAAQAARLWEDSDPDFAAKCLKQAKASWEAVKKHEDEWKNVSIHDEHFAPNKGSAAYDVNDMDFGDININDEAYWAACELFATTGDTEYYDYLTSCNPELKLTQCEPDYYKIIHCPQPDDSFRAFSETETLDFGTLSLYLSDKLSEEDRKVIAVNIGKAADNLVNAATRNIENKKYTNAMDIPYRQVECGFGIDPYSTYADSWKTYEYGSNSSIVNNAVILAYACEATGDKTYRDHAGYALDYIFGRNGLGISYVTGYGSYHAKNPSNNYWLNEIDKSYPSAPDGVLVGGPTGLAGSPDGIGDSFVKGIGLKIGETPDQQLYADSVQAWTCNSVTPQWQAALAWMLSFFENNMGNDDEVPTTTTTAASTTTTITTTTTSEFNVILAGDTNCDGDVDMADVVLIMQALANPNKYGENGTAENHLTAQGKENGDLDGDGLTVGDAQAIQKKLLNIKSATIDIPSSMSTVRLDDKVNVQSSEGKTVDEKFAAAEMKLGIELLKKSFAPTKKGEENLLISPMSVSAALAMTANGADGKTRSEMEKVLGNGLTLGQINEYMAYYLSKLPNNEKEKVYIADSIWFKDKPSFKVYEDFLEQNKKYYGAELYKAPFDDNTVTDINDWVSRNTNGMIPSILRNGDLEPTEEKEMLMMLLNTLYFEADWQQPYTHANNDIFTDINGEKRTIKSLVSKEYEYFDLGDADAFKKPYAGGNYSFVGILPRDNDIVEYVNKLDAEKLFDGLKECEDPESVDLYTMIPKFEYDYEKSLNDILKEMGMPTAFGGTADFSKINDLSVDGAQALWIDKVLHKTKIELNEKGTKAAAVTSVGLYGGGGMPDLKKEVFIYLNRPFVYMIVDKNNVPLFIGAATQLGEKWRDVQKSTIIGLYCYSK